VCLPADLKAVNLSLSVSVARLQGNFSYSSGQNITILYQHYAIVATGAPSNAANMTVKMDTAEFQRLHVLMSYLPEVWETKHWKYVIIKF
jgi:hypothetical protein